MQVCGPCKPMQTHASVCMGIEPHGISSHAPAGAPPWHHQAALLPLATLVSPSPPLHPPAGNGFRFWVDECLWSNGSTAVQLIEAVLIEAGGVRTGGPPRR